MIIPILKKNDICSYHRLYLPLLTMGLLSEDMEEGNLESWLSKAKVVIFNRVFSDDIAELLWYKKKYGFKIICDIDDYWEVYPHHIAYPGAKHFNMFQRGKEALMNSDFVFASTPLLAKDCLQFNNNVEVIPNGLPFGEYQFTPFKARSSKIRLSYIGGNSHEHDVALIAPAIRKLSKDADFCTKVHVSLCGYVEKQPVWEKMKDNMSAKGAIKDFETRPRFPLEEYMDFYTETDIALAPLEMNYFNMRKSCLKVIEAGCKNIPIITSNIPPYSSEPVIKCDTKHEWYRAIMRFVNNPSLIKEEGLKLGEYVREHYNIYKINEKRKQIFEFLGG